MEKNLILALETAVDGGSVSIWDRRRNVEIAGLNGEREISKAEDALDNIRVLLKENGIDKEAFGLIVFASGAGSVTGLKIGEATAKGLAKSFGCRWLGVSLWKIFADLSVKENEPLKIKKIYLPAGKDRIAARVLENGRFTGAAELITLERFYGDLQSSSMDVNFYIHESLLGKIEFGANVIRIGRDLAAYIAEIASDNVTRL